MEGLLQCIQIITMFKKKVATEVYVVLAVLFILGMHVGVISLLHHVMVCIN